MNDTGGFFKRLEGVEKMAVAVFLLIGKIMGIVALLAALLLLEFALVVDIWTYEFSPAAVGAEPKTFKSPTGCSRHCVCSNAKAQCQGKHCGHPEHSLKADVSK